MTNRNATLNYLIHYEKFKEPIAYDILVEYGQLVLPKVNPLGKGYHKHICNRIQNNWNEFITFYKSIKLKYDLPENKHNKMKPKRKKRSNHRSYDDWWSQSNLDGSFAYNGVTDDF